MRVHHPSPTAGRLGRCDRPGADRRHRGGDHRSRPSIASRPHRLGAGHDRGTRRPSEQAPGARDRHCDGHERPEQWPSSPPTRWGCCSRCWWSGFAVGAYDVGRSRLLGVALVTTGVGVAVATDPSDTLANLLPTLVLFVGLPVVLGFAFSRTHRDIAVLQLETAVLADEAASAAAAERRRIARELHDVVAHAVTLIAVQAEAGSAVLDTDKEAARRALDAIGTASRDALVELHRMLDLLGDGDAAVTDGGLARLPAPGRRCRCGRPQRRARGVRHLAPVGAGHRPLRVPDPAGGTDQRTAACVRRPGGGVRRVRRRPTSSSP